MEYGCFIHPCKRSGLAPKAFTLAEVLVVLTIIGVVASITIPALMNNINDQQYKTAYKKAYSDLSQALLAASIDNELVSTDNSYTQAPEKTANYLAVKSHFKVVKDCDSSSIVKCWANGELVYSRPAFINSDTAFIDSSGRS